MISAIRLYRIARWLHVRRIPFLPKGLYALAFLLFHASVPYTARIGKGTRLGYGGLGVVIHARAEIGENCIVSQQVTIGGRSRIKNVPVIEDRVYIGTGAKILGDVRIGTGAVIGANAVVVKDVPPRCVAAGVPARVIKTDVDIDSYMTID